MAPERLARRALSMVWAACATACAPPSPAVPAPRATETATPSIPGLPDRASALIGDNSAQLAATLGDPSLLRHDGDAEFWLYTTPGGCRVEIVLYHRNGEPTVAHVDAETPRHTSEAACLRDIAGSRGHRRVI
jgi:hypothetical protein